VTQDDIEQFMHGVAEGKSAMIVKATKNNGHSRVSGGKGAASRTIGLLGAVFTYAVRHRMRPDNPVRGVVRFADGRRERRVSDAEYAALGVAFRQADASIWPPSIAAARFLALTGWRSGEALGLRWSEIDLMRRTATLSDTKTGRSVRPLSHAACDVICSMKRFDAGDIVFPAIRGGVLVKGFWKEWQKLAALVKLPPGITPHTLRHSFASLAGDLGFSEPTIASLIGHQGHSVTRRYLHAADAVLLAAADAVADRTAKLMGEPRSGGVVVELRKVTS
jgi:integrase